MLQNIVDMQKNAYVTSKTSYLNWAVTALKPYLMPTSKLKL